MSDYLLNESLEKTKESLTMPVLIIRSAEEICAIPQIRISEIIRAETPGTKKNKFKNNDTKVSRVETTKGSSVLQLRGKIISLVSLSEVLGIRAKDDINKENLVIICDLGTSIFGILVDKVFHIEEVVIKPKPQLIKNLEIYSGSTILSNGNVAMIIDPNEVLKQSGISVINEVSNDKITDPEETNYETSETIPLEEGAGDRKHVLLVDDSAFFRKFMRPLIIAANYRVSTAQNGLEGLELLKKYSKDIDIVISDMDMPIMNGVEFLKLARSDPRTVHIPFIALTSGEETDFGQDIKQKGFIDLVAKSNRNEVVSRITEILKGKEIEAANVW